MTPETSPRMRGNQVERMTRLLKRRYEARGTASHARADALVQACGRNCSDEEKKWARINFIHGTDNQ